MKLDADRAVTEEGSRGRWHNSFFKLRRPTALTRVLQIFLPLTFGLFLAAHFAQALQAGEFSHQWLTNPLPAAIFDALILLLLTVGSWKRWAWAFWIFVFWLGANVAIEAAAVLQAGPLTVFNALDWTLLVGPVLFGACVYALVRYGRHGWAQLESSSEANSAQPASDVPAT